MQNVWAVTTPQNINHLFNDENDKYWHKYVRTMGDEYRGWLYHPENPQYN